MGQGGQKSEKNADVAYGWSLGPTPPKNQAVGKVVEGLVY